MVSYGNFNTTGIRYHFKRVLSCGPSKNHRHAISFYDRKYCQHPYYLHIPASTGPGFVSGQGFTTDYHLSLDNRKLELLSTHLYQFWTWSVGCSCWQLGTPYIMFIKRHLVLVHVVEAAWLAFRKMSVQNQIPNTVVVVGLFDGSFLTGTNYASWHFFVNRKAKITTMNPTRPVTVSTASRWIPIGVKIADSRPPIAYTPKLRHRWS